MASSIVNFHSDDVLKMFPVSFERPDSYDRVLSEENLIDWFRGVVSDSSDTRKNSPFSYVITDSLYTDFGKNPLQAIQEFTFMLGGYYIRVTDRGFSEFATYTEQDIYAYIEETTGGSSDFRHLKDGESINSDQDLFKAVKFISVAAGTLPTTIPSGAYKLHVLSVNSSRVFSIPPESKRSSFAVDGGEIA